MDLSTHPVLILMAIAVVAPLLVEIPRGFRLPAVVLEMALPLVSLSAGTTNTTAPSSRYTEACVNTNRLKVSLWVRILMLVAVRDTSTLSSNKSSLRGWLSRTSLKPSRRSVRRS